jgi:hypothetical protein
MELSRVAIALWIWVVGSVGLGIALIITFLGTELAIIGVVLIIVGLASILAAMQSTIGELPFDFAK